MPSATIMVLEWGINTKVVFRGVFTVLAAHNFALVDENASSLNKHAKKQKDIDLKYAIQYNFSTVR